MIYYTAFLNPCSPLHWLNDNFFHLLDFILQPPSATCRRTRVPAWRTCPGITTTLTEEDAKSSFTADVLETPTTSITRANAFMFVSLFFLMFKEFD